MVCSDRAGMDSDPLPTEPASAQIIKQPGGRGDGLVHILKGCMPTPGGAELRAVLPLARTGQLDMVAVH
jgi:hypothetical protein